MPLDIDRPAPLADPRVGVAMAVTAAVAFSFKAILVKLALLVGAVPVPLLTMRMLLAAPFFVALLVWRRSPGPAPTRREVGALLVLGLLGFYVSAVLDFLGLQHLTAGLERIVLYAHPTFVVLLAAAWAREAPSSRALAAIGVAWIGLAVAAIADLRAIPAHDLAIGVGMVLGAALFYAMYLLGVQRLGATHGNLRVASAANLVATAALAGHSAALHRDDLAAATPYLWGLALLMAVVSTVLPHLLLASAIGRIGPARASTLGMVGPVAASLLGWMLLGEPLSLLQLVGGALVVAGVSLARS